jgi:hypothetical protein
MLLAGAKHSSLRNEGIKIGDRSKTVITAGAREITKLEGVN